MKKMILQIAVIWSVMVMSAGLTGCQQNVGQASETAGQNETQTDRVVAETMEQQEGREDSAASEMEVHFIDVGQGDATLIKCGDAAMLIDAGEDGKGTLIQNYLQKQGVKKLDYLVLTHPDSDHIGGAPVIVTKFEIGRVFVSDFEKDNKTYRKLIQALDDKNIQAVMPKAGDEYALADASFHILGPVESYDNPNDASLAFVLRNGENRFLFTGDAEEEAEFDMLDGGAEAQADVYQAGHHGSKSSSTEAFLDAVNPKAVVVSCEEGNSYGHPHAQTLNNLRSRGIQLYRTDEQGSIIAKSDGKEISWSCAPSESWKAGEPTGGSAETEEEQAAQQLIPEQPQDSNAPTYVLNIKTKKFHYPSCSSLPTENRMDTDASREEVMAQGYVPCKRCNP